MHAERYVRQSLRFIKEILPFGGKRAKRHRAKRSHRAETELNFFIADIVQADHDSSSVKIRLIFV